MNMATRRLAILLTAAAGLTLLGCDSGAHHDEAAEHHHQDEPHHHQDEPHHHHDEPHHDQATRSLGSVTIQGVGLAVSGAGRIEPNARLDVRLTHQAGPRPAAIRLWLGDASGTGAMKIKAHAHDDDFHARVPAPANVDSSTRLWVEVQTASGQRSAKPTPIR